MSSQEFYPHVFTEQSWCEQTGGCGGLCLCNRSSSTMWLGFAPTLREKERHKTPEQKHATWYLDSSLPSLLLLSLNCSYQAVGGYPIGSLRVVAVQSHLLIFLSVSQPESILPPGWMHPVPVLLRLYSTEATQMKPWGGCQQLPSASTLHLLHTSNATVMSIHYAFLTLHSPNNGNLLIYLSSVA